MKTCSKCGDTKPTTEFSTDARNRDGLQSNCRACNNVANAKWKAKNREKVKADNAAWCAANRDKKYAINAKWRAANRDKANEITAAWKVANPERSRELYTRWHAAHRDVCRIHGHNYRARKRASGSLSRGLAERLFKLQRGKCACGCGQPLGTDYHLDHIMPVALGGTNTDDNIQLLTATCNMQKSAKHPVDFMQQRGFLL